jgi:hypothetical protein
MKIQLWCCVYTQTRKGITHYEAHEDHAGREDRALRAACEGTDGDIYS